ncbi:MAG TPA: hypothetical protein VD969_05975 [Symbiobacteriaceae bacterium]|nr:hypothetical protein [Symbiobacteriaceae bacterium]
MREERGSIYVEALIAVAIMALGLIPIFGGWSLTAGAQIETGQKNAALAIARAHIEPLHALAGEDWDGLPANETISDPAHPDYEILQTAVARPDQAGLKDVTITVSWTDRRGATQSVTLATAVARRP